MAEPFAPLRVRTYGTTGPAVCVLHGGPAAPGSAGSIARDLADACRVIEPFQRGSGEGPLSVARHVADLDQLVSCRCGGERPALLGYSWGAMLALAYAAEHPDRVRQVVLIGCGTFDLSARAAYQQTRRERISPEIQRQLNELERECPDVQQRFIRQHELTRCVDEFDPIDTGDDPRDAVEPFDLPAHTQTWNDMLTLQERGVYPARFAAITAPVRMLHSDYDPHPGPLIRDSLLRHMPQLEYRELPRCGHSPWNERHARDEFFAVLRAWLTEKS